MNGEAARPGRPARNGSNELSLAADADGRERALVDVRLWVSASSREEVLGVVVEFVERARAVAPAGVEVRWWQLRRFRGGAFRPTIAPRRRRRGRVSDELDSGAKGVDPAYPDLVCLDDFNEIPASRSNPDAPRYCLDDFNDVPAEPAEDEERPTA